MATLHFKEAVELLGQKLEKLAEEESACSETQTFVKGIVLGGYALQAICDGYDIGVPRETKDIDLYTPDARTLVSEGIAISPTGARIQLTEDFHAELFDWISGMDHAGNLEGKILEGINADSFKKLYDSQQVKIYLPTPEIFVANKLFAYRGQTSRLKDLNDVKTIISVLRQKDKQGLEKVESFVKYYGLEMEYDQALALGIVGK